MPRLSFRAFATATAATAALLVATAGVAAAHIDPDVAQIPAGEKATVTFTVEHGCGESPTTKLEIKIPDSVAGPQADGASFVEKEGWTGVGRIGGSDPGLVMEITGGPLDAHTEDTFAIAFTAPSKVGEELSFPIIQTCEKGEIDWIETSESDEHPAPVVTVGKAGSEPVKSTPDDDEGGSDEGGSSATTTTAAASSGSASSDKKDDTGSGPLIAGIVALVVVAGGGALLYVRNRKSA
jgi:uncharacterized protein YcnI